MELSDALISQFAKEVKANSEASKSTDSGVVVEGTAKQYGDAIYVQLDGSDQLTPVISSTAGMKDGDRVTVRIKDHSATVTGNVSSPSTGQSDLDEVKDEVSNTIAEFEIVIADKVSTEQFDAEKARIDELVADNVTIKDKLTATEADIEDLTADNVAINGKLTAAEAEIDDITATMLTAEVADLKYATIENLNATNADINNLEATYATIDGKLTAAEADIDDLQADKISAEQADIRYAKIDFANIGDAAIENLFTKSGIIDDLVVSEGHVTGKLVGVTIIGDLIEGGTVKADKLVVQGSDGLYYKLNVSGESVAAEQTEYNSLNGSIITANTITAEKINVDDLVAFDATIGGFKIGADALYSGVKSSLDNTTQGIYMDDQGQIAVGDGTQYLKYFKDTDGTWKLEISADSIKMSTSDTTIEETITNLEKDISTAGQITRTVGEDVIVTAEDAAAKAPRNLTVYGTTRQNLWVNPSGTINGVTITPRDDGSVLLDGLATSSSTNFHSERIYSLVPGRTYCLACYPNKQGFSVGVSQYKSDGTFITTSTLTSTSGVITMSEDMGYATCVLFNFSQTEAINRVYTVMLNEGEEPLPWCPPGVHSVGELSIATSGRNLAISIEPGSYLGVTATDAGDGKIDFTGSYIGYGSAFSEIMQLVPGETYTVSFTVDEVLKGEDAFYYIEWQNSTMFGDGNNIYLGSTAVGINETRTFTVSASAVRVYSGVYFSKSSATFPVDVDLRGCRLQLEPGEKLGPYEPPSGPTTATIDLAGNELCSLPDGTRDELHINENGTATITKRVDKVTLTGSVLGSNYQDNKAGCTVFGAALNQTAVHESRWYALGVAIADILPVIDSAYGSFKFGVSGTTTVSPSSQYVYVNAPCSSPTDYAGARSWLNEHPLTVWYKLAEPYTISLPDTALNPLNSPFSTVWADSSIPTSIKMEYWTLTGDVVADSISSTNEYIDEVSQSVSDVSESLSDDLDFVSDGLSDLQQDVATVEQTVIDTTTRLNELEQTAEGWSFDFTTIQQTVTQLGDEISTVTSEQLKYIKFIDGEIWLGRDPDPGEDDFKVVISNERIRFLQNNVEIAYISNQQLYITNAQVMKRLDIGNFAFFPRENGNLTLRYTQ